MISPGYQRIWNLDTMNLIRGKSVTKAIIDLKSDWKLLAEATVDTTTLYTITCRKHISIWMRENGIEKEDWYEHINPPRNIFNVFDITAEMMMLLKLTWGDE